MPHMEPVITYDEWIVVETDHGTEHIPLDVVGRLPDYDQFAQAFELLESAGVIADNHDIDSAWIAVCLPQVKDYVNGANITSIEARHGWGARLSAAGYMDCTEWAVFDTEDEAREYLRETYDICPDCGEALEESDECAHCAE